MEADADAVAGSGAPEAVVDAPGNVADLLRQAAERHGPRPAVITGDTVRTWAELDRAADAAAAALVGRGLPGGRVLVALPTSDDLALVLFGVARAGLVAVPLTTSRSGTAEEPLADVAPILVVGTVEGLPDVPRLPAAELAGWWSSPVDPEPARAAGEDLALLVRAGSSDHPVQLSHRAVLAAVAAIVAAPGLALRPEDRAVQVLPLSHLAGWVTAFLPLAVAGGATVIPHVPETSGGWIEAVLATIRTQRVTVVPAAPGLYRRLRTATGVERALATVRLMTSGASPLDPEDFAGVRTHTGQPVWEGYGIAESASVVASSLMTGTARSGSVGLPLPGVQVRIVEEGVPDAAGASGSEADADGAPDDDPDDITVDLVGEGTVGRIALRGPTLFSGYWPDGRGGPDADGWFVSDDVGYRDDRGELHLVDRAGESFRVAGFTVYPREIEEVLETHPYVRDAAVIGVPGRAGERVVAVLVAQRGTHPTPGDLDDFVAGKLPVFKRPERYRLVPRLPRSEVGRVDRAAVRRDYLLDPDPDPAPAVRLAAGAPAEPAEPAAAEEHRSARALRVAKPLVDRIAKATGRARPSDGPPAAEDDLF